MFQSICYTEYIKSEICKLGKQQEQITLAKREIDPMIRTVQKGKLNPAAGAAAAIRQRINFTK